MISFPNGKRLVQSAERIYRHAEKQYLDGDEEMAYVYYNRYFNMLNRIHQRPEYPNNKSLIRQTLGGNRTNKMRMDRLEIISKSLAERYDLLNNKLGTTTTGATTGATTGTTTGNHHHNDDDDLTSSNNSILLSTNNLNSSGLNKPNISQKSLHHHHHHHHQINGHRSRSSSPIGGGGGSGSSGGGGSSSMDQYLNYSVITHEQLFECMRLQNVLIMDCRPSTDYQASHLNYAVLLNVPEEHIKAG